MTGVLKAWIWLVVASAATTSVALFNLHGLWVALGLLVLALVKSRVILSDYLRLREVPPVRRGFMVVFVIWAGVAFAFAFAGQS
jgi:Prokaryotic Cytochrome C oxidase subunit IV